MKMSNKQNKHKILPALKKFPNLIFCECLLSFIASWLKFELSLLKPFAQSKVV